MTPETKTTDALIMEGTVRGLYSKEPNTCICCDTEHHRFATQLIGKDGNKVHFSECVNRLLSELPEGVRLKITVETFE